MKSVACYRKRLTDSENALMAARVDGEDRGKGQLEFGMDMYTLLYFKMDNQQAPTV